MIVEGAQETDSRERIRTAQHCLALCIHFAQSTLRNLDPTNEDVIWIVLVDTTNEVERRYAELIDLLPAYKDHPRFDLLVYRSLVNTTECQRAKWYATVGSYFMPENSYD